MTFGEVKSIIEKNIYESYKNETEFKKMLREFKHYVLNDKKMSKLYSLYDQLSSPQGLSESQAKEFLNEGIELIQKNLNGLKLPITDGKLENQYKDIDLLVYSNKTDIKERLESKKQIISKLMSENKSYVSEVNLPLDSMVKVANQTLNSYLSNLDEKTQKEFLNLISEDTNKLESEYISLKEGTITKLSRMLSAERDIETRNKIEETISKIENETFDFLNLFRLKNLSQSL